MKKTKLLILLIPLSLLLSGYLLINHDGLTRIVLKALVSFEQLEEETPQTPEVMDSWLVDMGVRSKYAILKSVASIEIIELVTGVSVFASGPHSKGINYYASTMGHYNPEFLDMAYATAKELFDDPGFTSDARTLYEKRFQDLFRAYYTAYQELDQEILATMIPEYLNYIAQGNLPEYYIERMFWDDSKMQSSNYTNFDTQTNMIVAKGFWLRRSIDGTDIQFLKLLNLVFEHLDPKFLKMIELNELKRELAGTWTNGDESFELDQQLDSMLILSGWGLHEGGFGYSIQYDDNWEIVQHEDQRALLVRNDDHSLRSWLRKMHPPADLYKQVLISKTNHQLSGKYVRADKRDTVLFYPNRFIVNGLSSSESYIGYNYAIDYIEFPMDIIYFSNGEGFAYEKTPDGLNIYKAVQGSEEWLKKGFITSLEKIDGIAPEHSRTLHGKFPFASSEILSMNIHKFYSKAELRIMRNEIFARHGYTFKTTAMQDYFGSQSWYRAKHKDVTSKLTPVEKLNIEIIQFFEKMK